MSTVIELIEAGAKRLEDAGVAFGHGTANAFDEAAWLVLWRLKLPLDGIDAVADTPVSPADADKVAALLDERIATRKPAAYGLTELGQLISYGASPRGPIALIQAARALAVVLGRDYVLAQDVRALVKDAFRHRLVLSYRAEADQVRDADIVEALLKAVS